MGVKARQKPRRLAEKLLQVRLALGLSQSELVRRLNLEETISYKKISDYERGNREPTLLILLQYARAVKISTDVLIDDELDLPEKRTTKKR